MALWAARGVWGKQVEVYKCRYIFSLMSSDIFPLPSSKSLNISIKALVSFDMLLKATLVALTALLGNAAADSAGYVLPSSGSASVQLPSFPPSVSSSC